MLDEQRAQSLVFALVALCLATYFCYEGYQSNFSLAKGKQLADIIPVALVTGSPFTVPLLIAIFFAFRTHDLPWLALGLLCAGALLQGATQNFFYLLVWPANVLLAFVVAVLCFARSRRS